MVLSDNRHIYSTLHQNKPAAMVTRDGQCLGANNIAICNIYRNAADIWLAQKKAALEISRLKED